MHRMKTLLLTMLALAPLSTLCAPPADSLADDRAALQALPGATSVLLQRGGRVLVEMYARGADDQTLHDTRSVGKSVTAMLVAAAVQDGLLSRDTPVFPAFADQGPIAHDGPAKQAITVEDLLTMSSALDCDDSQDASPGNEENMYPQPRWLRWALDLPTRDVTRDGQGRNPWAYCTAGSFLLGQLLERRVPGGLETYARQRLFEPLGIRRWQWHRSPAGETMTGGGLRLRTRDWVSLMQMLLGRGQGVLAPAQVQALLSVSRTTPSGVDYGELLWRRDFDLSCGRFSGWTMSGNGGNQIVMLPALDAVLALTRTHYNQPGMHTQSRDFTVALLGRHLCPVAPKSPPPG
jgi:CubicO group peptidase (beta-lactamase class C family)